MLGENTAYNFCGVMLKAALKDGYIEGSLDPAGFVTPAADEVFCLDIPQTGLRDRRGSGGFKGLV